MGNLKAALDAVRKYFKDGVIDERVSHAMQMAFEAYDNDGRCNDSQCSCHVRPEPKPDYKLEAGCQVRGRISGRIATVTYVGTKLVFLLVHDNGDETAWLKSDIAVTAPATPEVGDYVRHDQGADGVVHRQTTSCSWLVSAPGERLADWLRSDFTIIAKAPKQMP